MKYLHTLYLLFLLPVIANAQNDLYYYADGERMNLTTEKASVVVHISPEYSEVLNRVNLFGMKEKEVHDVYGRAIFHFDNEFDPEKINARFLGIPEEHFYSSVHGLRIDDGFFLALTHEVVAEFAEPNDLARNQVLELMNRYNASYSRNEYGTDVFQVKDPYDGLEFANTLEESGIVDWAHSDFYGKITKYNDPFYNQQFQMNNTGQTVNGWAGVAGTDCNAEEAWAITLGSANITVAIIDDGLEPHEDLVTSLGVSRVLAGNTPANGGNGTPRLSGDAHGTACAGILGATHNNNLGVRGVAPLVGLRSVNIFWGGETSQTIANGINWARTQGVDVMSNSWGYTSCSLSFSNLNNALNNARNNGRDGKGCVIVFAAGNGGNSCIDYPANRSSVMAVGSVTNRAEHSNYSNTGSQLSVVAPSDPGQGQAGAFVRTIDRMGSVGYEFGNYTPFFGGTSAACPVVAGAAALVLGNDPDLTEVEVRNLLESTATDMGSTGFDNTFGNGRINVGAAISSMVVAESICFDVNFDDYNISSYIPSRDQGTFTIQENGAGIFLQSNSLKYIPINYDVTSSTVIEFEFQSTDQGSIHAIALEDNNALTLQRLFKVYGTLNNNSVISDFDTYSGTALQSFTIPVGDYYTGNGLDLVVLSANVNGSPGNNGYFRNIRLYEGNSCIPVATAQKSDDESNQADSSFEIQAEYNQRTTGDFVLFPNPARTNVQLSSKNGVDIQTVQVFNVTGSLIEQIAVNGSTGLINLQGYAKGIYLVKWDDELGIDHQANLIKTE